jgi:hypothetical protein
MKNGTGNRVPFRAILNIAFFMSLLQEEMIGRPKSQTQNTGHGNRADDRLVGRAGLSRDLRGSGAH